MNISEKHRQILLDALKNSGVFITTGKNPSNVMSTHWGCLGSLWNKNIFILPVRKSKLSYKLIDKNKTFAISVPKMDMSSEIAICDHLSGYTCNKFEELHLHPKRAKNINTYVLGECGLVFECRVVYSADVAPENIFAPAITEIYNGKDFHSLFFAEIIDVYSFD